MLLQRLATGATGVKQARYRQGPTRAARHSYAHAQYTLVPVQCEGVMPCLHPVEFRRGFCTLVLFIINVAVNKGLYLVAAKLHNISATVGHSERMD